MSRVRYDLLYTPLLLYSFPPHNAAITYKEDAPHIFPSTELARSGIWEQDIRKTLAKPRYKKKDLDERRSKVRLH